MSSTQMRVIKSFFKIRKALGLNAFGRKAKCAAKVPKSLLTNTDFKTSFDFGFELNEVIPRQDPTKTIIYLHGGGYVNPISSVHWQFIEQLATKAGARVLVPRYGLAPHHDVNDALEFVSKVVGYANQLGDPIVMAGDSAGGGLALSSVLELELHDQIESMVLISPWLDSELAHPELPTVMAHDPWLMPESLRKIAAVFSGEDNYQDPKVAPVRRDVTGLPRTLLMVGDWDILLFDARWLHEKAKAGGVEIEYREVSKALHVYPLLPTPEGVKARQEILEFIAR